MYRKRDLCSVRKHRGSRLSFHVHRTSLKYSARSWIRTYEEGDMCSNIRATCNYNVVRVCWNLLDSKNMN